ncbi:hypothetical protein PUN28_010591 [Cardiocondyla obscurior]|uniref:Uncharacterized protein n=1 Tax=Cardiocondyla obscurior TaxID=286306 RepID=A0AAW2FGZ1_9HYME
MSARIFAEAEHTRRERPVGNGNLGVSLLPTMLPTISRFQASGRIYKMRQVAATVRCELILLNIRFYNNLYLESTLYYSTLGLFTRATSSRRSSIRLRIQEVHLLKLQSRSGYDKSGSFIKIKKKTIEQRIVTLSFNVLDKSLSIKEII